MPDDAISGEERDYARAAELVAAELMERLGEGEPQPRLEPTRRVADLLGDVHRAFDVIHVTGTNGKTSISRMIEAILRSYGLKTGLFTSPHLRAINERICIGGDPIANEALVANWLDIKPYVEMVDAQLIEKGEPRLTFFEVLTLLAFASFADAPVDVAVVEVGLGGEWDSTNIVESDVAVFGPIDLDHMQRLGDTIEAIARTKSGIIKPSSIVVSAAQDSVAEAVLREAAELTESEIHFVGGDIEITSRAVALGGQVLSVNALTGSYEDVFLSLFGDHQAENAALAIAAVEAFLGGGTHPLGEDVLREAFERVSSPGRLQLVSRDPAVIVDAAHNPHGARALAHAIDDYFDFDDVTLVFGVFSDKDADGMLRALAPAVNRVVVTRAPSDRARDVDELAIIARAFFLEEDILVQADPAKALELARSRARGTDSGAVVVAGSISLVGLSVDIASRGEWM